MNEESEKRQEPLSLDIIYDLAFTRLETQLREVETIDTKLSQVLAASSVVIGIAAGFFAQRQISPPLFAGEVLRIIFSIRGLPFDFLLLSSATYVVIVVLSALAYRFLGLQYIHVKAVWEESLYWEATITKQQMLAQLVQAIEYNKPLIARKVTLVTFVLGLLPFEVVFALLALGGLYLGLGGG